MEQVNIKNVMVNVVKKYLVSFGNTLADKFHIKYQFDDIKSKIKY